MSDLLNNFKNINCITLLLCDFWMRLVAAETLQDLPLHFSSSPGFPPLLILAFSPFLKGATFFHTPGLWGAPFAKNVHSFTPHTVNSHLFLTSQWKVSSLGKPTVALGVLLPLSLHINYQFVVMYWFGAYYLLPNLANKPRDIRDHVHFVYLPRTSRSTLPGMYQGSINISWLDYQMSCQTAK